MEGGCIVEGEEFGISTWYEYAVIFTRAIPRRAEGIALHYVRLTRTQDLDSDYKQCF